MGVSRRDEGKSDASAIAASLNEPGCFASVFDRNFIPVSSFVHRRIGADRGEEIVAETFARAFALRDRYDFDRPCALPWLLGIASNLMKKHWRAERLHLEARSRLAAEPPGGDPADQFDDGLRAKLVELPRGQREVLLLYALADLSYDEIAVALGIRIGTVRSRLARARRALRKAEPSSGAAMPVSHRIEPKEGTNG